MTKRRARKIRVLYAASEAVPFAKTGGLGDVAGSLPQALKRAGASVAVIMPKYSTIPERYVKGMRHVADFSVPLGWRNVYCGIEHLVHEGVDFYFVDNEDYFKRDTHYGHFDDGERFAFFSKAICEALAQVPELACDIINCNDWQTALVPVFLREFYRDVPSCNGVKCVFTIHNVKFQGQYSDFVLGDILGLHDVPAAANQLRSDAVSVNYMRGAVLYSDLVSTVSPTYAWELQTDFFGEGLDDIFRARSATLEGILNGIDTKEWNPATDPLIAKSYSPLRPAGKAECKLALQKECGLDQDAEKPLVIMIGRLTDQKGLGLVTYNMGRIMPRGVQMVVLGTGDASYEDEFRALEATYPGQMCAKITFDSDLSHRMYAGGDILLMPSEFEPCGLSQMIAMRYGTIPVVRETGGLKDSVIPYNKFTGEGTGFGFANINGEEMGDALMDACELFWTDKDAWHRLQKQAMQTDFSWSRAAERYMKMYHELRPDIAGGK